MRGDCQICDWQFSITSLIIKKLKAALEITHILQRETLLTKQQKVLGDGYENSSWLLLPGFGQHWMEPFNKFHSVLFAGRVF